MVRAPLPDFQVIFRRTPGLYLLLGTDSCIHEATDTWLRHIGLSRNQVLGRNLFEILADCPGERDAGGIRELRESLSRVLHLRRTDAISVHCYGVRHRQDELHERYWTLLNQPVLDPHGQVAWVIHRVRDMTALVNPDREEVERNEIAREQQLLIGRLRAANEELARRDFFLGESERRLAIAMAAGRLGSWEMTLPDRTMVSSALHKACFGLAPQDSFVHDDLRAAVHPEDRDLRQAALDAALLHGADYDVEYRTLWPDGSTHWVQIRGQVIRGPNGVPERMVGVSLDVTDRKRTEELLEAGVAERTRELALANARLTAAIAERDKAEHALLQAQRLEAIGQLTGGVAHDFNNLLAVVVGNLELLRAKLHDNSARRHVDAALSAAWRGGRLTQQLLAYARQQRLASQPVDLNALIAGMQTLLEHSLGGLIHVEFALVNGLWLASTDVSQLEMVLLNLAINARDAMPDGGTLSIATGNANERNDLPPELVAGDYVKITVSDTGTGMTPDVMERAFEPFFTTKGIGKGSGLGLAQAYGVARQCGGTVRLHSRPGAGTVVEVFLPRAEQSASTKPVKVSSRHSHHPTSRLRLLVVDDEPDVRAVTCELLVDAGYRIEGADSGSEALTLLALRRFDIAVVDYAMPGISGAEFVRRAREIQPKLRVLFTTGNPEMVRQNALTPADRMLSKPYGQADLLSALGSFEAA